MVGIPLNWRADQTAFAGGCPLSVVGVSFLSAYLSVFLPPCLAVWLSGSRLVSLSCDAEDRPAAGMFQVARVSSARLAPYSRPGTQPRPAPPDRSRDEPASIVRGHGR